MSELIRLFFGDRPEVPCNLKTGYESSILRAESLLQLGEYIESEAPAARKHVEDLCRFANVQCVSAFDNYFNGVVCYFYACALIGVEGSKRWGGIEYHKLPPLKIGDHREILKTNDLGESLRVALDIAEREYQVSVFQRADKIRDALSPYGIKNFWDSALCNSGVSINDLSMSIKMRHNVVHADGLSSRSSLKVGKLEGVSRADATEIVNQFRSALDSVHSYLFD